LLTLDDAVRYGAFVRPSPQGRRITRYKNRKLYDHLARRYVTLDGLARLVAAGHDVSVRDQDTRADITTAVLAQVVLEAVKERGAAVPREVLVRLIRLGRSAGKAGAAAEAAARDVATKARDEAETIVAGLLQRGRLPLEEALALRHQIATSLHAAVDEAQRGLEQRFHGLLEWAERETGRTPALQALKARLLTDSENGPRPRNPTRLTKRSKR
jgi:polyhydroxyalkanoate synthesis repressor PhaR